MPDITYEDRPAWGIGLVSLRTDTGAVLDAWFPQPQLGLGPVAQDATKARAELAALEGTDPERGVTREVRALTIASLAQPPANTEDAYLRLQLLSHRLVLPNSMNLDGIFGVLPNVVWTSLGPCAVEGFALTRQRLMTAGRPVTVYGVDKFPRMVDYVIPEGVRIADADRVRLGAHLAPGTTVMHEGFCNFNAGTLGASMIEGRIAQGVVVGDGSDVGGGASIMGTLSGGGRERVSIGRRTLLGANSGCGVALGDDCVVEAGLYITAGTKLTMAGWDEAGIETHAEAGERAGAGVGAGAGPCHRNGDVVKARELSGADGVMFIRNSLTGAVEARPRRGVGITLNTALHRQ